jgi:NadR type nicotinamide-nucleotide adenylyltransferase
MVERLQSAAMIRKIAIIGPECTGKTSLAQQLAEQYSTVWIPEYARTYIESLGKPYTFNDVERIALFQRRQIYATYSEASQYIFFDTDLIITKVWFEVVYNKVPDWLDSAILNSNFNTYLLCDTSLPWIADNVRENGGEMRETLFTRYKQNIELYGFNYSIITGVGEERLINAIRYLSGY